MVVHVNRSTRHQGVDVHAAESMLMIESLMRRTASKFLVGRLPVNVDSEAEAAGRVGPTEVLDQLAEQVGGLVDVGHALGPHALPSAIGQHVALHAAVE